MSIVYRLVGMILVLASLVLGGWYVGHLRAELKTTAEAARTAQAALQKAQATLALREKQRASSARKAASARASLNAASASNPAWAETTVPQEVQDALCANLDCAGTSPDGLHDSAPDSSP